jgi:hypothetical protein
VHSYSVSDSTHLVLEWQKAGDGGEYSLHLNRLGVGKAKLWSQLGTYRSPIGVLPLSPDPSCGIAAAWLDQTRATILIKTGAAAAMIVRIEDPYSIAKNVHVTPADGIFTGSGITAETQVKFTSADTFDMTPGNGPPKKIRISADGKLMSGGEALQKAQIIPVNPKKSDATLNESPSTLMKSGGESAKSAAIRTQATNQTGVRPLLWLTAVGVAAGLVVAAVVLWRSKRA